MVLRQLPAAVSRSARVSSNCTSFSASAKVDGETCGPTSGEGPNAGGAPGGRAAELGAGLRHAAAAAMRAAEERFRNCLREFGILSPNHIVAGHRPLIGAWSQLNLLN